MRRFNCVIDIFIFPSIFLPAAPEGCCNYPDELEGFWYWGASKILEDTVNAGRRSYYKDEVTTCELSETRQYDSPSDPPYTTRMLSHLLLAHRPTLLV